ncbi:MAG TPA: hypothetical protein VG796_07055 [Verrucomicrobiales bacterium]|nr:hypothetical protein [Verrucomicrobiales bacterium]
MSDSDTGKKLIEEGHLGHFIDAYAKVTGETLSVSSSGESPDFICTRPSGEVVGVELARSPHDYESASHDRHWTDRTMETYRLLEAVWQMIAAKKAKREAPHWRTPDNTILVIELVDYTFNSLSWASDASLSNDFADAGFVEIWLADHSTLEAFGKIRLIGLYPPRVWGVHRQPALEGKPFG